jgi:hypothetical protein
MFKNIQKYLLLNHPLLWNTKVVPALTFAILFHILFFGIGYLAGGITFNEGYYDNSFDNGVAIFFSVILSVLFFIVWFIFYIRNNGFKSFYPQKKHSLFKEWIIILLISILNISYSMSYLAGKNIHTRTYFTQVEIEKRAQIILKASIFIEGDFGYNQTEANQNGDITFNKKTYHQNSLMNKNIDEFYGYIQYSNFPSTIDALPNKKSFDVIVKTWMQNDNQLEIKKLMQDYLKLVKEHKLSTNLTSEKWFELTYHYPDFMVYENILRYKKDESYNKSDYATPTTVDVASANASSNYYLPHDILKDKYEQIFRAWEEPIIDLELLRTLLYVGIGFSLLLFSFKVTSGRSFIIAMVAIGVLWMIFGIISVLSNSGYAFLVFVVALISFLIFYFFIILSRNKGKRISDIILNLLLWSFAGFFPAVYALLLQISDYSMQAVIEGETKYTNTPLHDWLETNLQLFTWINVLITIAFVFLMTIYIKKWKGIAES